MAKKSLTQTQYLDEVRDMLMEEYEYDEEDFARSDIKSCLEAAAAVTIANCDRKNGCVIFGLGSLRLHKRKALPKRKGRNPATGEDMMFKARPLSYVPKIRVKKAAKDECMAMGKALIKKSKSHSTKAKKGKKKAAKKK